MTFSVFPWRQNSAKIIQKTVYSYLYHQQKRPWDFKPAKRSVQVHPGELATVMYEFQNVQNRRMAAQAIPSYAPRQATAHFNKMECFCFSQYTLEPGEKREWPVAFVIDPRISKDVKTITLSYTFFEVGGKTPLHLSRSLTARLPWLRRGAIGDAGPQKDQFLAQHRRSGMGHAGCAQGQGIRERLRQASRRCTSLGWVWWRL